MNPSARRPAIRLAFSLLFWRLMIGLFLLFALLIGRFVAVRVPEEKRVLVFLFLMPMYTATAFAIAAGLTVFADLLVRLVVRPRLLSWHAPRADADQSSFHLEPRESVVSDTPARMELGRAWSGGRLVMTDRRVLFLPNAWNVEPWSVARDRVSSARLIEAPRAFWGLLHGLPPRLEVLAAGEPPRRFALVEAAVALASFPSEVQSSAPSSHTPWSIPSHEPIGPRRDRRLPG